MQALFQESEEDGGVRGFGLIQGTLTRFADDSKSVPHIGWNSCRPVDLDSQQSKIFCGLHPDSKYYYVHSYAVPYQKGVLEKKGWTVATARYGDEEFIGAIGRDNVFATQFHPEKSGQAGLRVLEAFLSNQPSHSLQQSIKASVQTGLTRRIIACLDVRSNDAGDLVVTKGDQYDVREKNGADGGEVRNLGKPVEVAKRYYEQGADEITFLNITSFRNCPLKDAPMLEVVRRASETIFVPLTIGGGIRDTVDTDGSRVSALEVAKLYFRSGADKISVGGDAVTAAEEYYRLEKTLSGKTAIETISKAYGNQAIVVSVDPKKVYVTKPEDTPHHTLKTQFPNEQGQEYCWYQCYVKGGREARDIDVRQLVTAVEAMGAGEIMLNSIDKDGTNSGFDFELINDVKSCVKIPIIASSGAGKPAHFKDVFTETSTDAALGAGMVSLSPSDMATILIRNQFHRQEYTVGQVKDYLASEGLLVRPLESDPSSVT